MHLDLARSNVNEVLLEPGRSGRRALVERAVLQHAQAAQDRAPADLRSAIGRHGSLRAIQSIMQGTAAVTSLQSDVTYHLAA